MSYSLKNVSIYKIDFEGRGGAATAAALRISFGENIKSECPPNSTDYLVVMVPNYSEACKDIGNKLGEHCFVKVSKFLIDAFMFQKPLDISYVCPLPDTHNSFPWLTYVGLQGASDGMHIPEPPAGGGCPLTCPDNKV